MTIFRTIFLPQLGITHSPSPARSARPTPSSVPAKGQRVQYTVYLKLAPTLSPVLANTSKASTSHWRNDWPEMVFLNFLGAQESIPRHWFRQLCSLAGRYDNPIPTRFLSPLIVLKSQHNSSIPAMGARNQVGIGLSYRPASLCSLATQLQTRFLESIPRPIAGLKFPTLVALSERWRLEAITTTAKKTWFSFQAKGIVRTSHFTFSAWVSSATAYSATAANVSSCVQMHHPSDERLWEGTQLRVQDRQDFTRLLPINLLRNGILSEDIWFL